MTNRFYSPDQQFISNSGIPYAGGQLFFYATGTSTPQNTYADQALSIPNTNPVVLDSNGQAGSIFLQNLAYKVVLTDSNNNPIWTFDPVYTSDYSTYAAFQPWNGNPNGQVPGFAGTVGALPPTSAVWDYVDQILYVCTTTGNAASAVWTAVNSSTAAAQVPPPQGYLTLNPDSQNPMVTTDTVSASAIYYTPYVGNLVPIFNGASFVVSTFSQLTLTLTASANTGSTFYDIFVFSNSGVLTLVTGPAWAVSSAASSARGTGGGSTQIQRLNGLWVNQVQITGKNGASTYTIPANTATYLGTVLIDSAAGGTSCYVTWGNSRKWGVWNAYNRQVIQVQAGQTANYNYATAAWRQTNNNSLSSIQIFSGLPEEQYELSAVAEVTASLPNTAASGGGGTAIGLNNNTPVGAEFFVNFAPQVSSVSSVFTGSMHARAYVAPFLGLNNIFSLENGTGATATTNSWTASSNTQGIFARWRG